MLELMKSRHSQRLFRTKKRTFDLAVAVFVRSISIVLHMKLLSHDLNAIWCVRLPSRDAKSMLNVATFLKTAVLTSVFIVPRYFTLRFYRSNYFHSSLEEDIELTAVCGKVVEVVTQKCQHSILNFQGLKQ